MKHRLSIALVLAAVVLTGSTRPGAQAPAPPPAAGLDAARLARIADLVNEAIARKETPGAVVLVGRGDQSVYNRAFGHRAMSRPSKR